METNRLIAGLRQTGAKITAQRVAICEWLENNDSHPTAADVYAALQSSFPTMSLATVYNTLSLLATQDLIHEIGTAEDGSTRYDAQTDAHINLMCIRCHKVVDVEQPNLTFFKQIGPEHGFDLTDISIVVHGICADCKEKEKENSPK